MRTDRDLSSSEVKVGYISGNTFTNKQIEYTVVDDLAIFEGDIILGTAEEMEKTKTEAVGVLTGRRWPNGIIPYILDPRLTADMVRDIRSAIQYWEINTSIRFQSPIFLPRNHVIFDLVLCSSNVGMIGGRQHIGAGCGTIQGLIHEIGHTVGLWHEQGREDRNNFVRINTENIEPGKEGNFDQHVNDGDDIGPYDYCSIMHYHATAYSKNGQPTITVLRPDLPCANSIGLVSGLSIGDKTAVEFMYGPRWFDWERIEGPNGAPIQFGPGVSSWGLGRLDLFVEGSNGSLYHKWYDGGWSGWEPLGGILTSDPAAVSWGPGRIDVFVRGTDLQLYHKWYQNGWHPSPTEYEPLGGILTSGPAVCSMNFGRLDVFVRGTGDRIYQNTWLHGPWWLGWRLVAGPVKVTSDPAAESWSLGRLDVFARGTDFGLYHKWYSNGWIDERLGGTLTSEPAVCSWEDQMLDVFIRGTDDGLYHKRWYRFGWTDWRPLGGQLTSGPSAVSWGPDRIDVFARGADGHIVHKWYARA